MAKYQKYAEYKDSGVEWLGEIPKDWGVLKLKYAVDLISEKSQDSTQKYVGMENIASKNGKYVQTEEVIPEGISNTFKDNDVLFGKLRPYLAKSWLANFSGICSSELLVLRAKEICPKFLQYYTLTDEFVNQVDSSTYGSKMPRASWEFISLLPIPKCSFDLSIKIANFLDHETVKIDTLITKQEKLIELLKEKRQAVISHAVTKGLNSNVALKDSGVEWLGDVPKHWKISHLKYIASIYGRIGFRGYTVDDIVDEGEGALVLSPSNIIGDRFSLEKRTYLSWKKYYESPEIMVNNNDILLVKTGSTFGKSTIILKKNEPMTINPQMALIKGVSIDPRFLTYLFNSNFIKGCIEVSNTGSGMPTMTQENINNFIILIPTLGEDKLIADFLDREVDQIELIIKKAESAIQLMQERRTALISSAVTGKIDVRQWQNPNKNNEAKTELGA